MMKYLGQENSTGNINNAKVVIVPIPFEKTTSYGRGTAKGPDAIIKASPYLEFYDEELDTEQWKAGIYTAQNVNVKGESEFVLDSIEKEISSYITMGRFIIALGGEHTISYGVFQAFNKQFENLSILQFDAHSDLRDTYEGSKYSHACVMRRIWEKNKNIVQVGIRSQCLEEKDFIKQNNIKTYYAHNIKQNHFDPQIIDDLKENVYITIDVDYFDPSIMPSVGTPEPGGFLWYETLEFLKQIFINKNVVGLDVVELCPQESIRHPDFLVAKLIYKIIGFLLLKK